MDTGVLTVPLGDHDLRVSALATHNNPLHPGDDRADEADRSWLFRSIGYGHGETCWKDIVSTLRMVGYKGVLSIEHEDSLTASREGPRKAVDVRSRAVFETQPGDACWAE
jgi:DNA-(apurinic or apyrimidinic site) lyase